MQLLHPNTMLPAPFVIDMYKHYQMENFVFCIWLIMVNIFCSDSVLYLHHFFGKHKLYPASSKYTRDLEYKIAQKYIPQCDV